MTTPPAPLQPQPPGQPPAQPPVQTPVQHVVINPQPQNGLGIAGFITSLVGLITCGLLSPLGLLLSLIGLLKSPRGFAIAGTVLGLVGSVFAIVAGIGIVLGLLGLGAAAKAVADYATAHQSARQAYLQIEQQRTQTGAPATSAAADAVAAKFTDPWGTALHATVADGAIIIKSAGRDRKFDTSDDLRFTEDVLQLAVPPTTQLSAPANSPARRQRDR